MTIKGEGERKRACDLRVSGTVTIFEMYYYYIKHSTIGATEYISIIAKLN